MDIAMTKSAVEILKYLVWKTPDSRTVTRLKQNRDGSIVLMYDKRRSGDHIFIYEGQTILVLRPKVASRLEGSTLCVNAQGKLTRYEREYTH